MSNSYLVALTNRLSSIEKDGQHTHHGTHMKFDGNSIQCNKDVVCNGFLVSSKCEPNKIACTNQHKQILSANLSDFVKVKNLSISPSDDGTITIENQQDLSISSTPTFKMAKLTEQPSEQDDVVTKKYVDDKIVGLDEGVFEIGTQIKMLSTLNADSYDTGSCVISGGIGVAKDLFIGGGIHLPNENGILTPLNYFEEGTLSINWCDIWDHEISSTYAYQRIGKWIMLMFPYISHVAVSSGTIKPTSDTYLPSRLRPLYDITLDITGTDNGSDIPVSVTFYGDDGRIAIKPKSTSTYTGSGISGFNTFCAMFMAKQ